MANAARVKSILSQLGREPSTCWLFLQWLERGDDPSSYRHAAGVIRAFLTLAPEDRAQVTKPISGRYTSAADAAIAEIRVNAEFRDAFDNPYNRFTAWFSRGFPRNWDINKNWAAFVLSLDEQERTLVQAWVKAQFQETEREINALQDSADRAFHNTSESWRDNVPDDLGHFDTQEEYQEYLDDNAPWNT